MTMSYSITIILFISQLLLILSSGPCYGSVKPVASANADVDYVLEWIGKPEIIKSQGEKKQVSSVIYTGDESNTVTVTKDFTHSFAVSAGVTLDLGDLLGIVKAKFGVDVTRKSDTKTGLNHALALAKRSKGIVVFREQLVTLKGRARKVYKNTWIGCQFTGCKSGSEEVDIQVTSTEVDAGGGAVGVFSVEYMGTDKYKHLDFYHITNKTLNIEHALPIEEKLNSPYSCAERAEMFTKLIGVYDVEKMQCYLLHVQENNGTSFDREGHELGEYNYMDDTNLDASETYEKKGRQRWVKERRCDVIHDYMARLDSDSDYYNDKEGESDKAQYKQRYLCKSFEDSPGRVILMKRFGAKAKDEAENNDNNNNNKKNNDNEAGIRGRKGNHQREDGATTSKVSKKQPPSTPKPTAPPSHPKFYQLNGRNYAAPDVAKGIESETKRIKDIDSAYDCGEQAMDAGMYLAVYKPRERACMLEPVIWNHGRSMDTNGKQLGPFDIENLNELDRTNDPDKSKDWSHESNTNCDIIRETTEASFACKAFESTSNDSSVVMIRYVDNVEIKRVNRLKKQDDYDKLLFSRSQHPKFYSIKGKDYPEPAFKTLSKVNSSRHCGDLVLKNDKYSAVFNPKTHICIIKEVDTNDGIAFDRWNHRLGNYDMPRYTVRRTESAREFERWIDLTECDLIHVKEGGSKHCKKFPKSPDSVLMLRKVEM